MKNKENVATKTKRDIGYKIFYIVGIVIIAVISFFGNSYFAYEFFNSLFFDILSLVLIVSMLVVRSIQIFPRQKTLYGKIFTLVYFNMFALAFALRPFVANRIWAIILFLSFIVAIALLVIMAFKYIKVPNNYFLTTFETAIAILPLLFLLSIRQDYVGAQTMWIPVVVGGVILSICALLIFLRYFKNFEHFKKSKGELIAACVLTVLLCFAFAFVAINTINYAFDTTPTTLTVQVLDKDIQSGARQPTSFYVMVQIDQTETKIEVPVVVYYDTEIGDYIDIQLYKGALGYSYYIYEYPATN